ALKQLLQMREKEGEEHHCSIREYFKRIQKDVLKIEKELTLPHPLLHKRRFVLAPLTEINPDVYHPLLKKPIKEILATLTDNHAVEKILGHQDVCS
ncbi:unnamed protein product, partial [marine sediment metagenome]